MKPGLADKMCIHHQQLLWEVRNHADVRQLAEEALQHMVAPELMRAAITCDFMCETLGFLRSHFDVQDPDPACVVSVLNKFTERMEALFIKGFILSDSASTAENGAAQLTATQMVFQEVEVPEPCLVVLCCMFLVATSNY